LPTSNTILFLLPSSFSSSTLPPFALGSGFLFFGSTFYSSSSAFLASLKSN
jgi:hypothetical protein